MRLIEYQVSIWLVTSNKAHSSSRRMTSGFNLFLKNGSIKINLFLYNSLLEFYWLANPSHLHCEGDSTWHRIKPAGGEGAPAE